jgi:hypothetical protein
MRVIAHNWKSGPPVHAGGFLFVCQQCGKLAQHLAGRIQVPLIKSGSRAAINTNIREMVASGHPRDQAIAAALSTARKYGSRWWCFAMGG